MVLFQNPYHFFLAIPKANVTSILLFLLSMAVLQGTASLRIVYKRSLMAFPMELLLTSDLQNATAITTNRAYNIFYFTKHFTYSLHTNSVLKSFKYAYRINCFS